MVVNQSINFISIFNSIRPKLSYNECVRFYSGIAASLAFGNEISAWFDPIANIMPAIKENHRLPALVIIPL